MLIYYAGHGSLDVGSDEGYWLPVDAETDNPVNWISNNNITGQLRAMRAKHVMVVADSCYSGKLTRNVEAQLKTGSERSAWLERMASRRSRTALTSGGLEPVLDAGGGQYSVFAKAFLETLRDNTRVLDGQSLFDAIKRPIVVNADQTPEYADVRKAGHDGGDFIFVPLVINLAVNVEASEPAATAPALAPVETGRSGDAAATLEQETVFWQTVRDSKDPASFEVYLSEYPNANSLRWRVSNSNSSAARRKPQRSPRRPCRPSRSMNWTRHSSRSRPPTCAPNRRPPPSGSGGSNATPPSP